jgi:hypothetical protein
VLVRIGKLVMGEPVRAFTTRPWLSNSQQRLRAAASS